MLNEHELDLLEFVDPQQVRRLTALLTGGCKGRAKFQRLLAHDIRLDLRFLNKIRDEDQTAEEVCALLIRSGAPRFVLCSQKMKQSTNKKFP